MILLDTNVLSELTKPAPSPDASASLAPESPPPCVSPPSSPLDALPFLKPVQPVEARAAMTPRPETANR